MDQLFDLRERRGVRSSRETQGIGSRLRGHDRGAARRIADELVEHFDAAEFADRPVARVSGGQRRRMDLAASLVHRPSLLVLDEPTTGLDPRSRQVVWSTVRDLVADGVTLLLTTQYLEEADALADRIVLIDHGRRVASGTVAGSTVMAAQAITSMSWLPVADWPSGFVTVTSLNPTGVPTVEMFSVICVGESNVTEFTVTPPLTVAARRFRKPGPPVSGPGSKNSAPTVEVPVMVTLTEDWPSTTWTGDAPVG